MRPHLRFIQTTAASSSSSRKKKKKLMNMSHSKQPNFFYPLETSSSSGDNNDNENLFDFELQESDVVWGCNENNPFGSVEPSPSTKARVITMIPPVAMTNASKKTAKKAGIIASTSVPVRMPDWSRMGTFSGDFNDVEGEEEEEDVDRASTTGMKMKIPPHEYLAMRRRDSFSVHEGMGRTLKGRDLCRVRNEILKKIVGFED